MTLENSKRLYDHYVKTNQVERANEVLSRYPDFEVSKEEVEEVKEVEEAPKKTKKKVVKKE